MFYGALSTDFSTACVEKCFEVVAEEGSEFRVRSTHKILNSELETIPRRLHPIARSFRKLDQALVAGENRLPALSVLRVP
jgi:hypothetical protein